MSSTTGSRTYLVGLGQALAGDDGVGLAVIRELQHRQLPQGSEVLMLADPMDLVTLLESGHRVVLVDALLAPPPGRVVEASIDGLSQHALQPASSHGAGAVQAIRLAQALRPERLSLRILAITIEAPERYCVGLSPAVAAAVPEAVEAVLSLLRG